MKLSADWLKTLVMNGWPTLPGEKNRVPTPAACKLKVFVVVAWAWNVMPGNVVGSVPVVDPLKLMGAYWVLVGGLKNASTCWTGTATCPAADPATSPTH